MKVESLVFIILVVALVFAIIGGIVKDFRVYYPEAGNVSTSWEEKYNYVGAVNGSFFNIQGDIDKMGNAENGWQRILGGLTITAKSLITAILTLLSAPFYIIQILSSVTADLNLPIPPSIITTVVVMIIVGAIIAIVKFYHRSSPAV